MKKLCYLAVAGLVFGASGCVISSGDDGGDPIDEDDPRGRDVPPETTAACVVADDYPSIDPYMNGQAFVGETTEGDSYMFAETSIEVGGETHLISVDVWEDYGVFEDTGWASGSYDLIGEETDFDNCGCCVYVLEDYDEETNTYGRLLMADSGHVEITEIDPDPANGHLDGHITDATFREVNEDDQGYYEVQQGCTTGIGDYTFETEVAPVSEYPH